MRDKGFLYCALGLLAACDAYDASLLSSTRLGTPTAVNDENVGAGSNADTDEAMGRAGAGAAIHEGESAGSNAIDGETSTAGSAAIAQQGGASRDGSNGGAGAGSSGARAGAGAGAGAAGAGAGGNIGQAGAAANGGGAGASAGRGGAGSGGGAGGVGGARAGAGAGGGGSSGAADGGGCGEPGSKVWSGNGHCYFPLSALGSWNVSRDGCRQRSATLVTITSSQEQAFAATLIGASPSWIGLSKFGAAEFSWIDGEALSYTNWETGAPKISGEVAAALRNGTQQWFDDAVTASHGALCERP